MRWRVNVEMPLAAATNADVAGYCCEACRRNDGGAGCSCGHEGCA